MTRTLIATVLISVSATAAAVDAPEIVKGPYIGGSVTQARFDNSFAINDLDNKNTRWKGELGWRFADQFAVEATYVDFGKASAPPVLPAGAFSSTAHAVEISALGIIPVPYVDLFARVGAARVTSSANDAANIAFDDSATKFTYGWGAQWNWRNLGVRGEYQKFETGRIGTLNLASLGLTWTFNVPMTR